MSATATLPRWDMTPVFPALDSPEFDQAFSGVVQQIDELGAFFDAEHIGAVSDARNSAPTGEQTIQTLERALDRLNVTIQAYRTLSAYISAFVTTDTRDTLAQARYSVLQRHSARLAQLTTRFTAWIGTLDLEALLAQSEVAREHAFALRKAKTSATHLMSPAEEALYAELNLPGGAAWGKLHGNVTSQLSVPIEIDGETRETPMSVVRTLAFEADRDVRRRAYEAELAGWERVSVPLAAALNSIKGQVNIVTARRGWTTPLDAALFDAHIDRRRLTPCSARRANISRFPSLSQGEGARAGSPAAYLVRPLRADGGGRPGHGATRRRTSSSSSSSGRSRRV